MNFEKMNFCVLYSEVKVNAIAFKNIFNRLTTLFTETKQQKPISALRSEIGLFVEKGNYKFLYKKHV